MADERAWIEVGGRIAASRRACGLSQEELAGKVGLDRTAITKIEVGRRPINSLELVRLAEVLNRPLQSLVSAPAASIVSRREAVAAGRNDQPGDFAIEDVARDLQVLVDVRALSPNPAKGSLRAIVPGEEGWGPETAAAFAYSLHLGDVSSDGSYAEVDCVGVAVVNGDIDPGRRRSTLAHELGHHLFGDVYSADWGTDTSAAEQALDAFADYLECGVRVTGGLQPTYIPTGVAAAAIRAYRGHRISGERVIAMLRGQVHIDELPPRDEIPLESLRGGLR
ncbi:MAG TPA: XRE family transcriptional regulator [Trebonia sp.]|jgi:transcriptional regulator with XRE-family HTH domain